MHTELKNENMENETKQLDTTAAKQWLSSEITVRLPGWALAGGGLLALVLLLVALD